MHNDDLQLPALIRIAIAHYQFETIHPFLDGNGRMGRLLITLFLVSEGILEKPLLYLSSYFEKDKMQYYDNLMGVRHKNDMLQWLKYFLVGIEQTAALAVNTLSKILALKTKIEQDIQSRFGRRSASAQVLLNVLFTRPVVRVEDVQNICQFSYKAANDLVSLMQREGVLHEITGQSRNRLFVFSAYLAVFNES